MIKSWRALITSVGAEKLDGQNTSTRYLSAIRPLILHLRDIDARLAILRQHRVVGSWHRIMMRIVDDVLAE
jgi:hypothetical protein